VPATGRFDTLVGSQVAGYRIEALIGRGGMGAVYRAQEQRLGRSVALKVIAPELAQDDRFRERFLSESRIAGSLEHPHVIPIYRAGDDEGLLFLAMRYVEGTDLAKLLAEEMAIESRRALELLSQVAEALDAAHEQGLVHRDVKPSNVLIAGAAGREHCYLADFGLTKRVGSLSGATAAGEIVGTLDYVAPEQITGAPLDERADVYSLGCVLYECLTGQPAFPRATDVALLWAHVHEEPLAASKARPELPRQLDPVLARALAKEPDGRFRTAGELIAAARSALAPGDTLTGPQNRSRWALAALGAAAIVATTAVLASVFRSDSGSLSTVSANAVGVIDPASNTLAGEVPVGVDPESVVVGGGGVWVANVKDETVSRIDPATREIERRGIAVGDYPSDIAVGLGSIWVALGPLAEFARINPEQNRAADPVGALAEGASCGAPRASVAVGGDSLWFLCETGELGRVDPTTGRAASVGLQAGLLTSSTLVLPELSDLAFGLGSLWVVNRAANAVIEIHPATNRKLREITVGQRPAAIAVDRSSIWVANFGDDSVTRITIGGPGQSPELETIPVGDGPVDVAVGLGSAWVVNSGDRTVTRVDGETREVVATIDVGNEPQRIAAGEDAVWVTVRGPDEGTAE
jgi:serine/threonine protein kinase